MTTSISSTRRRRSPLPLAFGLLGVLTAVALLYASVGLAKSQPGPADSRALRQREIARRFYAGIDTLLATSNAEPLTALLAPSFVDHPVGDRPARSRVALLADLLAQREVAPDLRLSVAAVVVEGDRILAYLSYESGPTTGPATGWDTVEALRVEDGLIAERWSLGHLPAGHWMLAPTPTPDPPLIITPEPTPTPVDDLICGATYCT